VRRPERARLGAVQHVGEDAGVHVPAAHDAQHEVAAFEAAVDIQVWARTRIGSRRVMTPSKDRAAAFWYF
jgi:hypothetical protein